MAVEYVCNSKLPLYELLAQHHQITSADDRSRSDFAR